MPDIVEPYPPIPGYLDRPPEDVLNHELKLYPNFARFVTWATKPLFESVNVLPEDLENLTERKGAPTVLSVWHDGVGDIPIMSMIALRTGLGPIRTVSKEENMDDDRKRFTLGHLGAIPLKRDGGKDWMTSMLRNTDYVLQTERSSLGIFPQGHRGGDEFHDGVLRIAHRSGVPIVPIGLHGTEDDYNRLKRGDRSRVAVAIGEPRTVTDRRDKVGLERIMREQKERAIELHERLSV